MSSAERENAYDFGPYEDEYRGFDMRDDDSGRGPLILILALGVLLIFAGVVWNTYRQGVRGAEGSLPVLMGEGEVYKRAPTDSGGLQVAGQENGYYNQMDGMGDPARLRTFTPTPEAGVDLAGGRDVDIPAAQQASGVPAVLYKPSTSATRPSAADTSAHSPNSNGSGSAESRGAPIRLTNLQPQPDPIDRAVSETTVPPMAPVPLRFDQGGDYQVQLSALRSEEAAQNAWNTIRGGAPSLYQGAPVQIQKADLGARGVFYRLRVGTFAGRERAKSFCDDVKATGRDCMVVAKSS